MDTLALISLCISLAFLVIAIILNIKLSRTYIKTQKKTSD